MKHKANPTPWIIGLSAVTVLLCTVAAWQFSAMNANVNHLINERARTMMTTEWISGGQKRSYSTKLKEYNVDETPAQHMARHAAELAVAQQDFPPDADPGK